MNHSRKALFAYGILLLSAVAAFAADDPCADKTMATGGTNIKGQNNASATGNISGTPYHYEMWYQGGNNNSMTYYSDGTFSASWNGSSDFLARVGLKYNSTKTHSDIGYFSAAYNYTKSGTAGYGYIGIYGWTQNPEVEYYIIDDWFSKPSSQYLGKKYGEITVDGDTYDIYSFTRVNQPDISSGGSGTFPQFFSVRRTARSCGSIDVSAHFKKWDELFHGQTGDNGVTLKMGKLYEVKLLAEAGGSATGKIDYSYLFVSSSGKPEPPTPAEPQTPFKSAIAIPGTVEAEDYDKGGNNNAYYDTDGTNEGNSTYRTGDGVDVVTVDGGNAVGYTMTGEWLEYTVQIASDGVYDYEVKAATGAQAPTELALTLDSVSIAQPISVTNTADDWDTYTTIKGTTTSLKAGSHVLRLTFNSDFTNVDWIKFSKQGTTINIGHSNAQNGLVSTQYMVYDLQGQYVGTIQVGHGKSVSEALTTYVKKSGVYMLKNGKTMQKVVIQ